MDLLLKSGAVRSLKIALSAIAVPLLSAAAIILADHRGTCSTPNRIIRNQHSHGRLLLN